MGARVAQCGKGCCSLILLAYPEQTTASTSRPTNSGSSSSSSRGSRRTARLRGNCCRAPQKQGHSESSWSEDLTRFSPSPVVIALLLVLFGGIFRHENLTIHTATPTGAGASHSFLQLNDCYCSKPASIAMQIADCRPVLTLTSYLSVLAHSTKLTEGLPLAAAKFARQERKERSQSIDQSYRVPLYGGPNHGYCAVIGTSNMQKFCVLVDTGSSNLAIAATSHPDYLDRHFNTENTSSADFHDVGTKVSVSYTEGRWSGTLATDTISLHTTTTTTESQGQRQEEEATLEADQSYVALIESSSNFFLEGARWEGILGLAYPALAKPDSSVVPYWDSLRRSNDLPDVFSLRLCPPLLHSNKTVEQGGELVLGVRSDAQLSSTAVVYTAITQENFYSVLITNISVGNHSISMDCREFNNDQTIVDSGTTDIYLTSRVFDTILRTFLEYFKDMDTFDIPSGFWEGGSKLAWSSRQLHFIYASFPTVHLAFASQENSTEEFSLGITAQVYLRQVEASPEEHRAAACYPQCDFFVFGIRRKERGTIIGGNAFLGFTVIFDREADRIGFAPSTCQYQDEGTLPHLIGPYPRRTVADCECHGCGESPALLSPVAIASITIVFLLTIIFTCAVITCVSVRKKRHRGGYDVYDSKGHSTSAVHSDFISDVSDEAVGDRTVSTNTIASTTLVRERGENQADQLILEHPHRSLLHHHHHHHHGDHEELVTGLHQQRYCPELSTFSASAAGEIRSCVSVAAADDSEADGEREWRYYVRTHPPEETDRTATPANQKREDKHSLLVLTPPGAKRSRRNKRRMPSKKLNKQKQSREPEDGECRADVEDSQDSCSQDSCSQETQTLLPADQHYTNTVEFLRTCSTDSGVVCEDMATEPNNFNNTATTTFSSSPTKKFPE